MKACLPTPASTRRRRRQGGSVLIELGFVFMPFLAIFFATIDFSMAVFLKATFQNAVREGVRYAITYNTMSGVGQDASIKSVVQNNSVGLLANSSLVHVDYFDPSASLTTPVTGVGSNQPGYIVEVSVQGYSWGWLAPISGYMTGAGGTEYRTTTPLSINAYASDLMGGLPVGTLNPPGR